MFQPASSGSIAVPLRVATWELQMSATHKLGYWTKTGSATTPQDANPTTFPQWSPSDTYINEGKIGLTQ